MDLQLFCSGKRGVIFFFFLISQYELLAGKSDFEKIKFFQSLTMEIFFYSFLIKGK